MQDFIFPIITTERLKLRKFTEADTDMVHNAFSLSSFTENMLIDRQPDRLFAETYTEELIKGYAQNNVFVWAIADRQSNLCMGAISFEHIDEENANAEIGYWVADEYSGKGYATEALRALVIFAFKHMRLHKLCARCSTENKASIRVLKNAGFEIEGIARDAVKRHGKYISLAYFGKINKTLDV